MSDQKSVAISMDKILMCWEIAYRGASMVERQWLDAYREELRVSVERAALPPALPPETK